MNIIVIDMMQSNLSAAGVGVGTAWSWVASRWFLSAANIGLMVRREAPPAWLLALPGRTLIASAADGPQHSPAHGGGGVTGT